MSDPKEVSIFDGLERKKAVRATAGQRLANCLIDSFLFYFIFMILSFIASIIGHSSPFGDNLLSLYLQYHSGYVTIAIIISTYHNDSYEATMKPFTICTLKRMSKALKGKPLCGLGK